MANEKKKMSAELLERFKGKSAAKTKDKPTASKPKKKEAVAKKDGMAEIRKERRAKRDAKKATRSANRAKRRTARTARRTRRATKK